MAFTPEQTEILKAMHKAQEMLTRAVVAESERKSRTYIAALQMVLVGKELVTLEELEAAKAEIEAGMAVEEALNPELQAALEELKRLIDEASSGEGSDEGK